MGRRAARAVMVVMNFMVGVMNGRTEHGVVSLWEKKALAWIRRKNRETGTMAVI